MIVSRLSAALALALLPLAALAQESAPATEPSADATAETPAETPAAGDDLPQGEPVNPIGQPYVADVHGDWEMRCIRTEDGKDPCQLYQLLQDDKGNAVAEVSLFGLPEGGRSAAEVTLAAPLESLLTPGWTLAVDNAEAKRFPFMWCTPGGCYSRVGFTAEDVASFRRGSAAQVTIVPLAAPDQPVTLTLSLTGFTAGYDAVNASNAALAE